MKVYDAHIHFLFKCSFSSLQGNFAYLRKKDVAGFDALITP